MTAECVPNASSPAPACRKGRSDPFPQGRSISKHVSNSVSSAPDRACLYGLQACQLLAGPSLKMRLLRPSSVKSMLEISCPSGSLLKANFSRLEVEALHL